ncbi:MAG: ABC transporter permease [Rhodanobacter sp.]
MSLLLLSIRSMPSRASSCLVAIVGFAVTSAVMVSVLALSNGLAAFWRAPGSDDVALVMARGSLAEEGSRLSREATAQIMQAPGVRQPAAASLSTQLVMTASLPRASDRKGVSVLVRGFVGGDFPYRAGLSMRAGRAFRHGVDEVIVGEELARTLDGVSIGSWLPLGTTRFRVVGIFGETGGGRHESEIWGDANQLAAALGAAGQASSVYVTLAEPQAFDAFAGYLANLPDFSGKAIRESDYLSRQSDRFRMVVLVPGLALVLVMSLAAMLATVNTMLSAIHARMRELATLRAIGFSSSLVAGQIIGEALVLGALGGAIGIMAAMSLLHDQSALTSNGLAAMAFSLSVSVGMACATIGFVLAFACLAGAWPAVLMSRMCVADALRKT